MWLSIGPKLPLLMTTCRGLMASGDARHGCQCDAAAGDAPNDTGIDADIDDTPIGDVHRLLPQ